MRRLRLSLSTLRLAGTVLLLAAAFLFAARTQAADGGGAQPLVVELTLHDTVQPMSAAYLRRGLEEASRRHAALVIVSLDTPGGLLSSTREMVGDIGASAVPVVIFVSPSGARAGSAGFFLMEAADVAAMAPATNAGAAHPIIQGKTLDPILKEKVENDAAAFLRSYVSRRGRSDEAAAKAEDAIRNSKSYSDAECLKFHLSDLTAADTPALLRTLDGKTIHRFSGQSEVLHLGGARTESVLPSLRERILSEVTDPDIAVLLLLAGVLLIYAEFNAPGTVIPGAIGTLLVMLALFGLNLLPLRNTAVALLIAGVLLMLLEFKVPSHGVVALTGIIALVFGLLTLVDGPIGEMRVHPATAVGVGVGFGSISLFLGWIALRARRSKRLLGPDAMVGQFAVAQTALAPAGQVFIRGEIWQAELPAGSSAPAGTTVTVREVHGLRLLVTDDAPGRELSRAGG